MEHILALVAVENVAYHFDILYGYIIPEELAGKAVIGTRVLVSFGNGKGKRQGIIFRISKAEEGKRYKSILEVIDRQPLYSEEMISLAEFLKERTFCTYYEAAKVQLPTGFNLKVNVTYVAADRGENARLSQTERTVLDYMLDKGSYLSKKEILTDCGIDSNSDVLEKLASKNLVVRNYEAGRMLKDLTVRTAKLNDEYLCEDALFEKLTDKQKRVAEVLRDVGSASIRELCYFTGVSVGVVSNLAKKGIITVFESDVYRTPKIISVDNKARQDIILTEKQQKAYENMLEKYKNGGR